MDRGVFRRLGVARAGFGSRQRNRGPGAHAPTFMYPDIRYEDVPTAQVFTGHDGVIKMGAQALLMAKDIRFTCISAQPSDDQFAFETETHGTNTGAVGVFPAAGKPFVLRAVSVGKRTPQGTVIAHKDYWDLAGYLRQIGLMPHG